MNTRCRSSANLRGEPQWGRSGFIDRDSSDTYNQTPQEASDREASLNTLVNQIEFVRILSAAKNPADFYQRVLAVLKPLGFSDFVVARRMPCGTVEVPLCSLPSEFAKTYSDEKYSKYDMVLDYVDGGNREPIYLSTVRRVVQNASLSTLTLKKNHALLLLYQKYDVHDAYLIPVKYIQKGEEQRAVVSIMRRGSGSDEFMPLVDRSKAALQLLAEAVNCVGQIKFYQKEPRHMISQRPLQLLRMIAQNDISLIQAAESLNISVDRANKHIAFARKVLGTTSQANAVYLAVKQGLIPV